MIKISGFVLEIFYCKLNHYMILPLYFVRSGDIVLDYGTLRGYGESDYVWSRSAATYLSPTSAKTYYLYFNASAVRPSHGPVDRQVGFPVRCLDILVIRVLS